MGRRITAPALLAVAGLAAAAPVAAADTAVGVTGASTASPTVVVLDTGTPGQVQRLQVAGLADGDRIAGLDVRPATRTLYALGVKGRPGGTGQNYLVQLNLADRPEGFDGRATFTPVGARFATLGRSFGYDVNPTVDRIRVVSDYERNLRVNPDTGAATVDGTLRYVPAERRGADVTAAGYVPAPFGGTTTLFDIDARQDALVRQAPANEGLLATVGRLGVDVTSATGFDLSASGAFAALQPKGSRGSSLFRVDTTTGAATAVGPIGAGTARVDALALLP